MKLDDLEVYRRALEIGRLSWEVTTDWKYFDKDTVGKQCVRAADSIAANISEGFGRYHFKENRKLREPAARYGQTLEHPFANPYE